MTKRTFRYDKLVRDKVFESMQADGEKTSYRVLTDTEYLEELRRKILEEAGEMDVTNPEVLAKELADLQEVLDCLTTAIGKTKEDITRLQAKKNQAAGSFTQKIYVETTEVDEANPWFAYLRANPDRYPEIDEPSA